MTFDMLFRFPLEYIRLLYHGVLYELEVKPPPRGGTIDDTDSRMAAVLQLPPPSSPVPADSDERFAREWGAQMRGLLGPQFASHWLRPADARDFANLFPNPESAVERFNAITQIKADSRCIMIVAAGAAPARPEDSPVPATTAYFVVKRELRKNLAVAQVAVVRDHFVQPIGRFEAPWGRFAVVSHLVFPWSPVCRPQPVHRWNLRNERSGLAYRALRPPCCAPSSLPESIQLCRTAQF